MRILRHHSRPYATDDRGHRHFSTVDHHTELSFPQSEVVGISRSFYAPTRLLSSHLTWLVPCSLGIGRVGGGWLPPWWVQHNHFAQPRPKWIRLTPSAFFRLTFAGGETGLIASCACWRDKAPLVLRSASVECLGLDLPWPSDCFTCLIEDGFADSICKLDVPFVIATLASDHFRST